MKALVSGGTGFIGGALVRRLLDLGWEVNAIARPASQARLASRERLKVFAADLEVNNQALEQAAEGCDVIFHAAAIRNRWGTSPTAYRQTNVEGTRHLLAASPRDSRFIYISSVGVYGRLSRLGIDENLPLASHPDQADYHSTKADAEQVVLENRGDIETVIIRPTITYGPGDQDGMLTRLVERIACGRFVRIGRGMNHLHLVFIDDLVDGLLKAAIHPSAGGQVFILAGPQPVQVRDLTMMVERAVGRSLPELYIPEGLAWPIARGVELAYRLAGRLGLVEPGISPPVTPGQIDTLCRDRSFSWQKASHKIGYLPRVEIAEGLQKTIEWMCSVGRLQLKDGSLLAGAVPSGKA